MKIKAAKILIRMAVFGYKKISKSPFILEKIQDRQDKKNMELFKKLQKEYGLNKDT